MGYPERKVLLSRHMLLAFVWFATHAFQALASIAAMSLLVAAFLHPDAPLYSWPVPVKVVVLFALMVYRLALWWLVVRLWTYPSVILWIDGLIAFFPTIFGASIAWYGITVWFGGEPGLILRVVTGLAIMLAALNYQLLLRALSTGDESLPWDPQQ